MKKTKTLLVVLTCLVFLSSFGFSNGLNLKRILLMEMEKRKGNIFLHLTIHGKDMTQLSIIIGI